MEIVVIENKIYKIDPPKGILVYEMNEEEQKIYEELYKYNKKIAKSFAEAIAFSKTDEQRKKEIDLYKKILNEIKKAVEFSKFVKDVFKKYEFEENVKIDSDLAITIAQLNRSKIQLSFLKRWIELDLLKDQKDLLNKVLVTFVQKLEELEKKISEELGNIRYNGILVYKNVDSDITVEIELTFNKENEDSFVIFYIEKCEDSYKVSALVNLKISVKVGIWGHESFRLEKKIELLKL